MLDLSHGDAFLLLSKVLDGYVDSLPPGQRINGIVPRGEAARRLAAWGNYPNGTKLLAAYLSLGFAGENESAELSQCDPPQKCIELEGWRAFRALQKQREFETSRKARYRGSLRGPTGNIVPSGQKKHRVKKTLTPRAIVPLVVPVPRGRSVVSEKASQKPQTPTDRPPSAAVDFEGGIVPGEKAATLPTPPVPLSAALSQGTKKVAVFAGAVKRKRDRELSHHEVRLDDEEPEDLAAFVAWARAQEKPSESPQRRLRGAKAWWEVATAEFDAEMLRRAFAGFVEDPSVRFPFLETFVKPAVWRTRCEALPIVPLGQTDSEGEDMSQWDKSGPLCVKCGREGIYEVHDEERSCAGCWHGFLDEMNSGKHDGGRVAWSSYVQGPGGQPERGNGKADSPGAQS